MATLNKIMVIGNTGRDAELRMTPNGKPVASFSIAVNRSFAPSDGGERREETEWFNIVAWNRLAEFSQQYVTKGRLVYIEGRLQTRKWTDREQKERTTVEIVANDIQLLGGPRGERGSAGDGESGRPVEAAPAGDKPGFDPDEIPF
ncbi:MAG: single-stranded DNA-binding protein [Chloroflexi bacterium]|nr:MAG: single-stranded DNA-binding protein [Chloroflexota bacterium]